MGDEPAIRRAAGLGRAPTRADPDRYAQRYAHCDVLVVGAGPAGLSEALGSALPPEASVGQQRVRSAIRRLTERAQHAGVVRPDIDWRDIVFLPKSVLTSPQCLGLIAGERSWERILTVLLDGLRTPVPSPLPGTPPSDG